MERLGLGTRERQAGTGSWDRVGLGLGTSCLGKVETLGLVEELGKGETGTDWTRR